MAGRPKGSKNKTATLSLPDGTVMTYDVNSQLATTIALAISTIVLQTLEGVKSRRDIVNTSINETCDENCIPGGPHSNECVTRWENNSYKK